MSFYSNLREELYEIFRHPSSSLDKVGKGFALGTLSPIYYNFLPSTMRLEHAFDSAVNDTQQFAYLTGFGLGITAGVGLFFAEAGLFVYAVNHQRYEILALPVVTNIASAVYERLRRNNHQIV